MSLSIQEAMALFQDLLGTIEEMIANALKRWKVDLSNVTGTIPPQNLPSSGNTGSGYTPAPANPEDIGGVRLGGDLSGTASAPVVVGVQGIPYSPLPPTDGQAYVKSGSQMVPTDIVTQQELAALAPAAPRGVGAVQVSLDGTTYTSAYPLIEDGLWLLGDNNEPLYGEG